MATDDVHGGKWAARPLFALDADLTVYWPWVRPCWEEGADAAHQAPAVEGTDQEFRGS